MASGKKLRKAITDVTYHVMWWFANEPYLTGYEPHVDRATMNTGMYHLYQYRDRIDPIPTHTHTTHTIITITDFILSEDL
jgi:hypothetical protein